MSLNEDHTMKETANDISITLSGYWAWLHAVDSRLREIVIALDDEHCTGRVGSRQQFEGELEVRLLKVAKDYEDFKNLYVTFLVHFGMEPYKATLEAIRVYNIAMHYSMFQLQDLQRRIAER